MARAKKKEATARGKISTEQLRSLLNKKAGETVAYDLGDNNPTDVIQWIPTGARWLDSIICKGKLAGIPVGKVSEIAGLTATGKSYMAAQIAANAQKMGIVPVYFDSESALDSDFLINAGCDLTELIYIQARSIEFVLETIEDIMAASETQHLFILDSLAFTPTESDKAGDFNPQSSMAVKPRVMAKGLSKLIIPLANTQSTFLILNQLKTNISSNLFDMKMNPYFTPGGKATAYSYSLRVWLTGKQTKDSAIYDDKGYKVGSEIKARLKKSRFGTENRTCEFKILWGTDSVAIQDEESWLEAIRPSDQIKTGAWNTLFYQDGTEKKFQRATWLKELEDPLFRAEVLRIMDEEVIQKFESREGNASDYYDDDNLEE